MNMLEDLKVRLMNQNQIKVKKVSAKDIRKNLRVIQDRIELVNKDIDDLTAKMAAIDRIASENDNQQYLLLEEDLKSKNEIYSTLQTEMKSEYDALKKYRDSRFSIAPDKGLMIGGMLFIGIFALALERENPKALKLAQFILKLMPMKV